jgi:predicted membrane protein
MIEPVTDTREFSDQQHRGPSLAAMLTGLTLLAVGVIWFLDASNVMSVSWYAVFAIVLTVVGLGLVIGSFTGEHGGLIALGVVLTVMLTVSAWADIRFEGGLGDREIVPAAIEHLEPDYRIVAGTLTLDLRQIDFPDGETRVEARVGAGELIVLVPQNLAVDVNWRVAAGDATVFNQQQSGVLLEDHANTQGYDEAGQRLHLDLIVTTGTIEVQQ